jgi:hypothetical protein
MGIENFEKLRRDGKIITEKMKPEDVAKLGPFEPIVELRWQSGERKITLSNSYGIWGIVVRGRKLVAAKQADDDSRICRKLDTFNGDGTVRHSISNSQFICGEMMTGQFSWFEKAKNDMEDCFGVVFQTEPGSRMFQLDVNAYSGKILGAWPTR